MQTVLGIDLGTQSLKVLFYDYRQRSIAALVSSPLEVDRDSPGKAEQHVEWWLAALADCMSRVSPEIKASVQAIAVSGQQHGFVPLGADGKVLAPVKLWCDTSTGEEVEQIDAGCGGRDRAIALGGNPVLSGYTAPKIRWLKNRHPGLYRQLAHILLPHDYLNYLLTGRCCMEYGDASGTGLLDVRTRQWSPELLRAVDPERDLASCLPPLLPADEFIGTTTDTVARSFGLPSGIPVATGGGDNMMAAIGTGNVEPGRLTISLGSSGTLYAYADAPVIDPKGDIAAFCSSTGGWLPLLCTMNCTLATETMRKALQVELDEFDAIAGQAPPGCEGLVMLPFFNGERSPDLPGAKACMFGMDSRNSSRAHMLRSTLEGTSFGLKSGMDALNLLGLRGDEIVLTGGGAKSPLWRQLIADLFDLPVTVLAGDEAAALGAALQALWVRERARDPELTLAAVCAGHLRRDEPACTEPVRENVAAYREAYARYRSVLRDMQPLLRDSVN